jgi:hypothetical protein
MTHKVTLIYQDHDDRIKLVLSTNPVIHEFRPRPVMVDWLNANCPTWPRYRTTHRGRGDMRHLYAVEFEFEDLNQALLFKLTWGGE